MGKLMRQIQQAREKAIANGKDPNQAERAMRQKLGMAPMDRPDIEQRKKKGKSAHPALDSDQPAGADSQQAAKELADELADVNINGKGSQLTALQIVKRDAAIIQLIKRGISPAQAGAQFGLKARRVQQIIEEYEKEAPDLEELDPGALVRHTLWNYEAAIEELALLASKSDHGPTKVGAIRVRLEALRGRLELLQSVGAVPHDLGQLRVIDDAQATARQILQVFDHYDIPEDVRFAIVDVIEGRTPALNGEAEVEDAVVVEADDKG